MNTRKFPRTLEEAFGPYTSREISEPVHKHDRIVMYFCAAALVALFSTLFIWG